MSQQYSLVPGFICKCIGFRKLETHLHPLVSYCLMLLMKWTFFGTLGPGEPETFLNLSTVGEEQTSTKQKGPSK